MAEARWDAVISDHHLPRFSSTEALQVVRASGLILPFIIVSGLIGEETAVAAMREGADDFLVKGRLARLGPALLNALAAAEARRERLRTARELEQSQLRLRELLAHLDTVIDEERSAIAREIHDDVGGLLTALRFDLSTVIDGPDGEAAAVALWIAPGEAEMADDAVTSLETLVHSALDPAGLAPMLELWDRFDTNHPSDPPHAYLNLLATHPAHRGLGIAQGLLAESLARFDAAGLPTYLESTNPANDHRYRRAGYERIGEFATPHTGSPVARMWRDAR